MATKEEVRPVLDAVKSVGRKVANRINAVGLSAIAVWNVLHGLSGSGRKVLLVGSPFHRNLGDHAQTLATIEWATGIDDVERVAVIDSFSATRFRFWLLRLARLRMGGTDLVLLHSGYHLSSLYRLELDLKTVCLELFNGVPTVILPQTADPSFGSSDEAAIEAFCKAANGHDNLILAARDKVSLEILKVALPAINTVLLPDIVTTLTMPPPAVRVSGNACFLCTRDDKEAAIGDLRSQLQARLTQLGSLVIGDTESRLWPLWIRLRLAQTIRTAVERFAESSLTVTDRYHGTIFSLLSGTPVVVLSSRDHKLSSGVDWFADQHCASAVELVDVRTVDDVERVLEIGRRLVDQDVVPRRPFNFDHYISLGEWLSKRSQIKGFVS